MDKKEVRREVRLKKAALTREYTEAYSARLAERFTEQPFYREASVIYPYLAYNQEILTDEIIRRAWADGKKVAVPRILAAGVMEFYYIDSFDEVKPGSYNIPEPEENPARLARDERVLILMPGMAFGRDHNRIGYGGGYYDRYLEQREAEGAVFFKAALAYEFQIYDTVPAEDHDMRVDAVLTATELL